MINISRYQYIVPRLLLKRRRFCDFAEKSWDICPEQTSIVRPATFLEGDVDKITGVPVSYEREVSRVHGGEKTHAATKGFLIKNVSLNNGYLYKKNTKVTLTSRKENIIDLDKTVNVDEAALSSTYLGNNFFGHWLIDDMALSLATEKLAPSFRTKESLSTHQEQYLDILDINFQSEQQAKFKSLYFLEDWGQNLYKKERCEELRKKVLSRIKPSRNTNPKVMMLRGGGGVLRYMENENEIAEYLKSQGFDIIDPLKCSVEEILRRTYGASIIVGIEGSHLCHSFFSMSENGTVLTFQPPYRFTAIIKDFIDCIGANYAFIVGEKTEKGFYVELDSVKKILDLII